MENPQDLCGSYSSGSKDIEQTPASSAENKRGGRGGGSQLPGYAGRAAAVKGLHFRNRFVSGFLIGVGQIVSLPPKFMSVWKLGM